jgi:hypothetical protein
MVSVAILIAVLFYVVLPLALCQRAGIIYRTPASEQASG